MKKIFLIPTILLISLFTFSQETVKLMFYNLLNFNNYTSYCTSENNSHVNKANYLKTIVLNQQPDILAVCEVGTNVSASYTLNYILGNSLNVNGETKWLAASPTGSYLVNGLFYDKNKFQLISQPVVTTEVRDINIYKLKCLDQEETTYFNIIVAHLKAGNSSQDASDRASMIDELMEYLQNLGSNENFVIVGDFNVYTDSEQAFQKLINPVNPALAFYDPINKMGDWNNNYSFRAYHTQSTHSDSDSDCHSYGGMDDRFDFILISSSIKDGTYDIKYKTNSYWAVGQDGLRYNNSINYPTNTTLPAEVIEALYNMSDHLPVVSEFYLGEHNSVGSLSSDPLFYANVLNPVSDVLQYQYKTNSIEKVKMSLFSVSGVEMFSSEDLTKNNFVFTKDISWLANGIYIINFSAEGINQSFRIVKCE
ncbi:MAG TPA: T9SS type A sorting domain-containing protein [Bacteroidales bacterium]|nr:T9SS type A sorting domain-containing protein [Bacteroidales bacterium]